MRLALATLGLLLATSCAGGTTADQPPPDVPPRRASAAPRTSRPGRPRRSPSSTAGRLLAVPGEPAVTAVSLVIGDGAILGLVDGYVEDWAGAPDAVELVDLRDQTVLPGLIDCHTHLTGQSVPRDERIRRGAQRERGA